MRITIFHVITTNIIHTPNKNVVPGIFSNKEHKRNDAATVLGLFGSDDVFLCYFIIFLFVVVTYH